MRLLKLPYPQAEEIYRRMAFHVIARNCDNHAKNFAFRLKKDGNWELSPAYDVCFAYRPDSDWVNQHNLSIHGKRIYITKEDLLFVAKSMNIKKAFTIIQKIDNAVRKWHEFAEEAKVDSDLKERIGKLHLTL
jgi:serine/threonine-protein kinase HipA